MMRVAPEIFNVAVAERRLKVIKLTSSHYWFLRLNVSRVLV